MQHYLQQQRHRKNLNAYQQINEERNMVYIYSEVLFNLNKEETGQVLFSLNKEEIGHNPRTLGGQDRWIMRSGIQDQPGQDAETPSLLKIQN